MRIMHNSFAPGASLGDSLWEIWEAPEARRKVPTINERFVKAQVRSLGSNPEVDHMFRFQNM
jgi:hypothetical protein